MTQRHDERALKDAVLKAVSAIGPRWFRQNVGILWTGNDLQHHGEALWIKHARPVRAGLCDGSSDLIGWTPVTVTPDMVGMTIGVFTAVELKTGRLSPSSDQRTFLANVHKAGGIAAIVRHVVEAVGIAQEPLKAMRREIMGTTERDW